MCTTTDDETSPRLALANKACTYLTASPDPFFAVQNAAITLEAAGFVRVSDSAALVGDASLLPGGKYYYTVHRSTLVAFVVGKEYKVGESGFKIIGGHTDSPNLRVKPRSKKTAKAGCLQLGVECYGGGLWHTWFDRDLGICGKVLVREENSSKITNKLVKLQDPVARVSTLCIHLQNAEERKSFTVNKEDHTIPVIATTAQRSALEADAEKQINGSAWHDGHEPLLLRRIAEQLDCTVEQIADFELSLFDTQGATLGGMDKEFLYSARIDNLATVFCAVEALVEYSGDTESVQTDKDISMVVAFDHEEIGSSTSHGAASPVMEQAIQRISFALQGKCLTCQDLNRPNTIAKSFVLSVDMAHAVHPNYSSKHESQHGPSMNAGIVIKSNSNQRYATNSMTGFLVREIGRKVGTPIQEFVVRNDCPCGSTIGPIISTRTGIRTVDIGMPQLSMHSCREVMGVDDLTHGLDLFKAFFKHFREIDDSIEH